MAPPDWRRDGSVGLHTGRSGRFDAQGTGAQVIEVDADAGSDLDENLQLIEQRIGSGTLSGIVKVHTTHCYPNYSLPWQKLRQYQTTSSGFVIDVERRWILTNAHSVQHHTVVRVKRHGSDSKFTANVLSEGFDCDLALLTVKDDAFWEGVEEIRFGKAPHLQQAVTVIGYPVGGENISVTTGVVSRIEMQQYSHCSTQLLGIQIDAAINAGNSGGPTIDENGMLVGIAFQSLSPKNAENIGYIIANSVADHFLADFAKHERYTGFCDCGFDWQKMENPHLRESLGMKEGQSGILVRRVEATLNVASALQKDDVILDFDGTKISNDGTVEYRKGERVSFGYLVSNKFVDDACRVTVLREGKRLSLEYKLSSVEDALLVSTIDRKREPEYFTVAGLVFVVLSDPYLKSEYGDRWDYDSPVKLLNKLLWDSKKKPDEQVVILSQVLDAEISSGYEFITNTIVLKFNGTEVENLRHLADMVESTTEKYMRFDLDYDEVVVLETKVARTASKEILAQHGIPHSKSFGAMLTSEQAAALRSEADERPSENDSGS
mmetsp:Transcript_3898/g.11656  ORF Transcript_3898/g.11656 Transcript_3898/m.11656 type:complete len:549 (-) Transcript_3898:1965-3611(-)